METKKDILETVHLHSEGVQDILAQPPHWMVRWGNTTIFLILLLVLLMSYLMKYPEFVPSKVIISSQNPPEKLEARTNTKIEEIFVEDHQQVSKDQLLMVLQSTADYRDVVRLRSLIDSLSNRGLEHFPLGVVAGFKLGEIQADYNAFAKALTDEQLYARLQPYSPDYAAADRGLVESRSRIRTLQQQKMLEQSKYEVSKREWERYQELFREKVVSAAELSQEKIKFLQAEQNLETINISISQLQEGMLGMEKTRSGAAISAQKDKINLSSQTVQLFEQLRKSLNAWEQNYLLTSSANGTVSFQQFLGKHQFVKTGDILLSVMPDDKDVLIGRLQVPATNSGKVKVGQKVLFKLENYPYQEFGMVEGKVKYIANAPDKDGNYYVNVVLTNGLQTSFHKTLTFDKELKGNAEIVTQDLRLIERFFYQLRKLLRAGQ
ncbi:HlyD family efflux transporter periplasmic adaptor subunit [Chitinophaga sp. G-6-1-13]|uniref:HlyD family efflux transporter periplasmic adaptor subunit n=1 Tax=Chitinophaga fulva TaxID=2728842 RepID=A0A848GS37_9BACT|nr:HlyD family efflux transporter periplasmic adaptor subunit [Chitinophaga fulva]NML39543.1 HlyD family efflux transporter periplasmic adaptor subunit [Chitinophaga fulva]